MAHLLPVTGNPAGGAAGNVPILMTPRAVEMAKQLMARDGLSDLGFRIGVDGGGCSGFQYSLNFDEPRPDDVVYELDGLRVFVDAASLQYLKGTTIDYVAGLHGAGFKFLDNPNATRTCGCGSSFSA